jgi:hypothetical protein
MPTLCHFHCPKQQSKKPRITARVTNSFCVTLSFLTVTFNETRRTSEMCVMYFLKLNDSILSTLQNYNFCYPPF